MGEFSFHSGLWWLANVGSSIAVTINDEAGPSLARLAPGMSMPIVFETSSVRFDAGGTSYELTIDVVGMSGPDDEDDDDDENEEDDDGEIDGSDDGIDAAEMTTTSLPLTADQFVLLCALAGPMINGEESASRARPPRRGTTSTRSGTRAPSR